MIKGYDLRQLSEKDLKDKKLMQKICEVAEEMSELFGRVFDWRKLRVRSYIRHGRFVCCFKDGELVGMMLSRLYPSIFDENKIILRQDHLSAKPGSRAAYLLMKEFIDFGKSNANHIITMVTPHTNIKGRTLERLGFKVVETLYRMEI